MSPPAVSPTSAAETSAVADAKGAERAAREVDSLRAYAFRALRFLFSMERNRKVGVLCEVRMPTGASGL